MFGIGARELVVSAVIALIVFGPERLPELAAQLAKALRDVRRLSDELTGAFQRGLTRDDPATPDQTPAVRETVAPATADAAGSTIARSLRVETIPDELSTPSATAPGATPAVATPTGDRPHDDATIGRASLAGTTAAGPRSGLVGDAAAANGPRERADLGPTPTPSAEDGPGGLATALATTDQAGAAGARGEGAAARYTPLNPAVPVGPAWSSTVPPEEPCRLLRGRRRLSTFTQ